MTVWFEWDAEKATSNQRKHGVNFNTATLVFGDRFAITEQDRIEDGEQRWRTLDMADGLLLLLVAHTLKDIDDEDEVVRIISAREATAAEGRRYRAEWARQNSI